MILLPYRDENTSYSFPFVTVLLITVNTYFFISTAWLSDLQPVVDSLGLKPSRLFVQPYTLVTSLFLHGSLLHLVGNMWFLWLYGDNIEDNLGRFRFIAIYLMAGIAGSFLHSLFNLFMDSTPVVGASGAVAGIMGSYMVRFPHARIRCIFFIIFYPIFIRIRAIWLLGGWMVIEFFSAYFTSADYVAHWAHVGGFAFGFIYTYRSMSFAQRQNWRV